MATLTVQQAPLRQSRSPPPPISTTLTSSKTKTVPISSRHIPYCSPGPAPSVRNQAPATPPASPPVKQLKIQTTSLLHPPDSYHRVINDPPVYSIDAAGLARALDHACSSPLPDPSHVFPWMHGLHSDNQLQLAFFLAQRRAQRKTPACLRGITIIKAGDDLSSSKLKGAISPAEVLAPGGRSKNPAFFDVDPKEGFSVRSFHIQVAKLATVSDIVIYRDDHVRDVELWDVARRCAGAQKWYRDRCKGNGNELADYSTFVVSSPFCDFEKNHPELVAIDCRGQATGQVVDFFQLERQEMCSMAKASEIANNVWLGPTPDVVSGSPSDSAGADDRFDILIEASDLASLPSGKELNHAADASLSAPQKIEFPSSGSIMPPTWSHGEVDALLHTCEWIYKLANPQLTPEPSDDGEQDAEEDADGDIRMRTLFPRARRFLIHCADGYTESSLLALAYFMYAECVPAHAAWLQMHCEKGRNFFAYPSDVSLLTTIQPRIMHESPRGQGNIPSSLPADPPWLRRIDGSLPSRILPYMYLGNLGHANNPDLLAAMGIRRVLSVGEPISWPPQKLARWGPGNLMFVDRVQDNGVDPLTDEFDSCLAFIERGKKDGVATLVHCRVGVSRSATICIAEVMASMGLSFPRAYCFVRARRLNVIIQPHLRFVYELLKWEEAQQLKRGRPLRRELEWAPIAREIAAMNKPYTK